MRYPVKVDLKISHPAIDELVVSTKNVSDSGLFILVNPLPALSPGTVIRGQVLGMPSDTQVLDMKVVRVDADGIGLQYLQNTNDYD